MFSNVESSSQKNIVVSSQTHDAGTASVNGTVIPVHIQATIHNSAQSPDTSMTLRKICGSIVEARQQDDYRFDPTYQIHAPIFGLIIVQDQDGKLIDATAAKEGQRVIGIKV